MFDCWCHEKLFENNIVRLLRPILKSKIEYNKHHLGSNYRIWFAIVVTHRWCILPKWWHQVAHALLSEQNKITNCPWAQSISVATIYSLRLVSGANLLDRLAAMLQNSTDFSHWFSCWLITRDSQHLAKTLEEKEGEEKKNINENNTTVDWFH